MVATSGAQLLPGDAVRVLREELLPMTTIVTPNVPEATLLLRDADVQYKSPENLDELKRLAKKVHDLGPKAVLLKGGHLPLTKDYKKSRGREDRALIVDVLHDGTDYTLIESEYLSSKNTHGTGCSLASAIAANLASGQTLPSAVSNACRYVEAGIKNSQNLGQGNGPINHFHSLQRLPFAPGRFIEYLLDRQDVKDVWQAYTQHPFVKQIGNGTLPRDVFKHYMVQDYLYLTHFARAHALAAYKSKSMDTILASAQIIVHIDHEMKMHLEYCKEFGLSKTEIEQQKESLACVAYSRWVLDIGHSEDYLALQISLASCLLGYGVAAQKLTSDSGSKREGNPYWKWVENYVAEDYQEAVKMGSGEALIPKDERKDVLLTACPPDLMEKLVQKQSPSRIEDLVQIFICATEMEIKFWEMDAHAPVSKLT